MSVLRLAAALYKSFIIIDKSFEQMSQLTTAGEQRFGYFS